MATSKKARIRKLTKNVVLQVPAYRFDMELDKTEMITMRVTRPMKDNIKMTAHRYGLTVTEYLTQLHRIIAHNCHPPEDSE